MTHIHPTQVPRTNFDNTPHAMLTVFVVMSGENWNDVWTDSKVAVGPWCICFYVLMVVCGNYVLLNLFVAILLSGLEADDAEDIARHKRLDAQAEGGQLDDAKPEGADTPPPGAERGLQRFLWDRREWSFLLVPPASPVRRAASYITSWSLGNGFYGSMVSLDNLIVVVILLSSGAMAFESCDLVPGSHLAATLEAINAVATIVFVLEMVLKMTALGVATTTNSYLSSGWNRLDCFIVTSSLLTIVLGPAVRVLRVLRVLRPLRLISKFGGMRVVITLMFKTMPKVVDVLFVATFILLIFAILGVQLFAGRFASCSRGEHLDKVACEAVGGLWANPAFGNFDDIAAAALLLFEMAGMEGWPDVMYQGIDAVGVDEAPVRDASVGSGLFFVLWIVVGGT